MSTKVTRRNSLYGYPNPQAGLQQEPLVMQRDPLASDAAEVGTIWCNTVSQSYWILTSSQGGVNTWTSSTGGAETVTSLTVDPGDITVTDGDINVDTGNVTVAGTITGGAVISSSVDVAGSLEVTGSVTLTGTENSVGTVTIDVDGGTASTLVLSNQTGTDNVSAIVLQSVAGGISIFADQETIVQASKVTVEGTGDVVEAVNIITGGGTTSNIVLSNTTGTDNLSSIVLQSTAGGISSFAALDTTIQAEHITLAGISNDAGAVSVVANGGTAATVVIENTEGTDDAAININAVAGGVAINADTAVTVIGASIELSSSDVFADPDAQTAASPTAAVTSNHHMVTATFTGFTTAAAASQVFTITNSLITATSSVFVSAANLGANDAQMTVTRVVPGTGSLAVTLTNNGAQALDGNVIITVWVVAA
jgi:hypothetical protein